MPDVHARLSASGSAKWLNCPGSVSLESEFPDKSSPEANEGTVAHALGELKINYALGDVTRNQFIRRCNKLARENNCEELPADMQEYTDSYCNYVMEVYHKHKSRSGDTTIAVEKKLDFFNYVPDGFGTGDCVIVSDGILDIIDLKYGKGVLVESDDNPQLKLYALGALEEYDYLYGIKEVHCTIYQPRKDNISVSVISVKDLREWGESIVRPRAKLALNENSECIAGKYCDSHFCKARAVCRAYNAKRQELAKYDFAAPAKLSVEEIADILEIAPQISKWCDLVQAYALDRVIHNGVKFPGFKLVEGTSRRKIVDAANAEKTLLENGYTEDEIIKKSLIGLKDMEKLVGKELLTELIGKYIVKPVGAPCLVPETDKRPELGSTNSARVDFEGIVNG